jgi:hypothetical protein
MIRIIRGLLLHLIGLTDTHHTRQDSCRRVIGPKQRPLPDNTQHSQDTDIHASMGFEPAIPASEQLQTHTLDGTAAGNGLCQTSQHKIFEWRQIEQISNRETTTNYSTPR